VLTNFGHVLGSQRANAMVDVVINSLNGLTAHFDVLYKSYHLDRFDSIYESNIDAPLAQMAGSIGASGDTLKLVFALLLAYPFAFFHRCVLLLSQASQC
jgi:hypothetical protein